MIKLKNINYTKYTPVQLRGMENYFIYTIDKHKDFDEAGDQYYYFCHPLNQEGEADFKKTVILPKNTINSVPIRL